MPEKLSPESQELHRRKLARLFIKGPVPMAWMRKAIDLKSWAALALSCWLWHRNGMRIGEPTTVSESAVGHWLGLPRSSIRSGVKLLESAGLISVTRRNGHATKVVINH